MRRLIKGKAFIDKPFFIAAGIVFLVVLLPVILLVSQNQQVIEQHAAPGTGNPQVYYGNYVPNGFQIGANLATIEADGGKSLAIIPWYLNWTSGFPANTMTEIRNHCSIPELTWQPDGTNPNPTLLQITSGTYDSYLTKFAQAAKAWGHPLFLRFAHEMNGGYSWSEHSNGNSIGQYAPMWRHVVTIFRQNGATNVTWVWCPNIDSPTSKLAELYPGDSYVDWTCMDGYNWGTSQSWGTWRSFNNLIKGTYQSLLSVAPSKPIMIGETASVEQGGNKAAWITDALTVQLPNNFPQIKAFLWFNEANTQWRIETSPASQQAFSQGIASPYYASNQYCTLSTSPIQPLASQNGAPQPTAIKPTQQIVPSPNCLGSCPTHSPSPTKSASNPTPVGASLSPSFAPSQVPIAPSRLPSPGNKSGNGKSDFIRQLLNVILQLLKLIEQLLSRL